MPAILLGFSPILLLLILLLLAMQHPKMLAVADPRPASSPRYEMSIQEARDTCPFRFTAGGIQKQETLTDPKCITLPGSLLSPLFVDIPMRFSPSRLD